jgi:hypothetical protein
MILSEGAGALLLGRAGSIEIEKIFSGPNFSHRRDAPAALDKVYAELCHTPPDLVAASANGTFIDRAEHATIAKHSPAASIYSAKQALGESVGASTLWQTIVAGQALLTQRVPGFPGSTPIHTALISACGLNQQTAGLRLSLPKL